MTDKLTGLVWLKNTNCPGGTRTWQQALQDVKQLNTGGTMNSNGYGDQSNSTDWRLPNIRERHSLVDYAFSSLAISNAAGTGQGSFNSVSGGPFINLNFN